MRCKAPFSPLISGGHQERNRRGDTESVPLIVGMWKAVIRAAKENRLKNHGSTTQQMERDAMRFVQFVTSEVQHELRRPIPYQSSNHE